MRKILQKATITFKKNSNKNKLKIKSLKNQKNVNFLNINLSKFKTSNILYRFIYRPFKFGNDVNHTKEEAFLKKMIAMRDFNFKINYSNNLYVSVP